MIPPPRPLAGLDQTTSGTNIIPETALVLDPSICQNKDTPMLQTQWLNYSLSLEAKTQRLTWRCHVFPFFYNSKLSETDFYQGVLFTVENHQVLLRSGMLDSVCTYSWPNWNWLCYLWEVCIVWVMNLLCHCADYASESPSVKLDVGEPICGLSIWGETCFLVM